MRKLKKIVSSFCSILLAASIMLGSAAPAFAANSLPPEESSSQIIESETLTTPESTVPDSEGSPADSSSIPSEPNSAPDSGSASVDSSSDVPDSESASSSSDAGSSVPDSSIPDDSSSTPADSSSVPTEPDSSEATDSSSASDSSEPSESDASEEEAPKEEPPFEALAIADFTPQPVFLEDGQAQLRVELNRDDVAVSYQWQGKKAVKVPELLFDYTNYSDTSYYFPYADLTEAELLAMNPDATWPGIEMYLAAVEAAGGDASAVNIENGAENTYLRQVESAENAVPEWQDIAGATESSYVFAVDEESAEAVYRCVITITDESYLAQAAEQMKDVYGPKAEEALENTATEESAPTADSNSLPAEPAEAEGAPEEAPAEEAALTPETRLITEEATVPLPEIALFGLRAYTGVEQVKQDGPFYKMYTI